MLRVHYRIKALAFTDNFSCLIVKKRTHLALEILRQMFILLLLLAIAFTSYSQTFSDPVSFEARNEPLRSVLNRLSAEYGLNLTYNASDPAFDAHVNYITSHKTPKEILKEILKDHGHDFRGSGNHIVIVANATHIKSAYTREPGTERQNHESQNTSSQKKSIADADLLINTDNQPIKRDTIIIRDTLTMIETRIVYDTIFVDRTPPRQVSRPESLMRDVFGVEIDGFERWALGISFTQMLTDYSIPDGQISGPELQKVKDTEGVSLRNFGLGAILQYNMGNLSFSGSLGISSFSRQFSYFELFSSGGFNQIDTLDVFFTIQQNDTIYTYITDTTWIPLESQEIIYDQMNRFGFFETGAAVSWVFYAGRNLNWYAKAGFQASTPLWLRAQTVENTDGFPATPVNKTNFNSWIFAWSGSLGARMRLSQISDIFAEAEYRNYINEWNLNHPIKRRMYGLGVRLGVLYYF